MRRLLLIAAAAVWAAAAHAANQVEILGSSSGSVIVQPQAIAGAAIKTSVPNSVVTNGILQTDGTSTGNTSWITTPTLTGTNFTGVPTSGLTGQVPKANGGTAGATGFAAAGNLSMPYIVCNGTLATVTGTLVETSVGSCTIPANTIGANGTLTMVFYGTEDSGTTNSRLWTARYGPNNTIADTSCSTVNSTSTTNTGVLLSFDILGQGTTSTNNCSDQLITSGKNNGFTNVNANTAVTTYVNVTCTLANTGDNCTGKYMTVVWAPSAGGN